MTQTAAGERNTARRHRLRSLAWTLLPAAALLVASLRAAAGVEGRFQAALAGLVLAALLGAFGTRRPGWAALRVAGSAGLAALAFLLLGADPAGAARLALLYGAVAVAASGLAAVGRALRTPFLPAGAVAATVLWVAMAGTFWADAASLRLPKRHRRPFCQAVLHVDASLALAYDAAAFDRLRQPGVYFEVPLASSLYARPTAAGTAVVWLATGLAAWTAVGGAAVAGHTLRRRRWRATSPPEAGGRVGRVGDREP